MEQGSPEWLAWNAARLIDTEFVDSCADRAADEAAYGCTFPDDAGDYSLYLSELEAKAASRDGKAWSAARRAALLRGFYPEENVRNWFRTAGVENLPPGLDCSEPCGAVCDQFLSDVLREGVPGSQLDGPKELRRLLEDIAKSERRLADQLGRLHHEAKRGGHAATERGRKIRAVYSMVFGSLLDGVAAAARLSGSARSFLPTLLPRVEAEGTHYVGGQIMWEAGLRRSADQVTRLLSDDQFWLSLPSAKRLKQHARPMFVQQMSELWAEYTGTAATFSDDPRSQFYKFMRAAYGHMRGLREAANSQGIEKRLRRLGLDPIPTARTMKKDLQALEANSSD